MIDLFAEPTWEDYDEERLDFSYDDVVRIPQMGQQGGRARVIELRRLLDGVLSGSSAPNQLLAELTNYDGVLRRVLHDFRAYLAQGPDDGHLLEPHVEAYERCITAVERMALGCLEVRQDYLRQGMSGVESAVDDIDALLDAQTGAAAD